MRLTWVYKSNDRSIKFVECLNPKFSQVKNIIKRKVRISLLPNDQFKSLFMCSTGLAKYKSGKKKEYVDRENLYNSISKQEWELTEAYNCNLIQVAASKLSNNSMLTPPTLPLSLLRQTVQKGKGTTKVQQTKIDIALCRHSLSSTAAASGAVVVVVAALIRESNFSDFPSTISIYKSRIKSKTQ